MKTIYKYPFTNGPNVTTEISVPSYTPQWLGMDANGNICLWAVVNPDDPEDDVRYRLFATGERIPEDWGIMPGYTVNINGYLFHLGWEWQ